MLSLAINNFQSNARIRPAIAKALLTTRRHLGTIQILSSSERF